MTRIQSLPLEVVQLMAAGEVIDSPGAVVRELVENALDAGAARIVLEVRSQPWRIQVTDNGHGLAIEDLRQAATSHSTSKLSAKTDLWNIHSLGFRGEALHSLSRLSRLTLCSRPQPGTESGFCVTCDRTGRPSSVTPVAMAPGTRITVEDLFYPMPTRQQAAPSLSQQLRAIQQSIYHLALCHPHATWQAILDDRPWFTLWPGQSALHLLPQVMRRLQVTDLRETQQTISLPDRTGQLYLLLGLPDRCHRRRPDGIIVALNGRPIQLPDLTEHLLTTLRRSLPRDRYPVVFLHLQAAPQHIDWHRSPDKARVYLQHLDNWLKAIDTAINITLNDAYYSPTSGAEQQRLTQLLRLAEPGGQYRVGLEGNPEDTPSPIVLKALSQVHNRYILAEHPAGLCLIEQHIAHERVLYEELCDRWEIMPLSTPIVLSNLSDSQVEQLQRIGLTVDPFGPDLWAVRTLPAPLINRDDSADALQELSLGGDLDSALVATACRTAIRNGTPMGLEAMQNLLNAWQRTRKPQTCPHGRPICLTLNE
ncbi:MAG: DNA mismatch repair endonuclease MutL, partial [Leptolyngbya sp. SIO1D8]|nr:DNA mismatch repair endonuclease MutL [Leptolyngbya sp. SIO1D8]